jgi:hypothetical protein
MKIVSIQKKLIYKQEKNLHSKNKGDSKVKILKETEQAKGTYKLSSAEGGSG